MATFIGIAISLGISGWVYGDAKSRNSSHPMLWAVSVFCLLIVFLPFVVNLCYVRIAENTMSLLLHSVRTAEIESRTNKKISPP